ncbi:hypothetical protein E3T26_04765 [Cryobacterium sp. TMT1-21]|uniref:hypothetical protein n=1 Tax=Cryobacterium sp. TMT1-21 TaxID=1259234 RepID=UPI00106CBD33|nr:hypothetical protein [Cryobacterium sp. TMT1-21]TFD16197.1 hypothetical protein E3T26_04765 [Cryobacterium sp. TMT1-21]
MKNIGPITPISLEVGDQVKLRPRGRWTVRAVSANFAALVRQVPFAKKGTLQYTVIDWRKGIRGPCDLIGQGYGDGSYTQTECTEMLLDFEYVSAEDPARIAAATAGRKFWRPERHGLEISHRNNLPLDIESVNGVAA